MITPAEKIIAHEEMVKNLEKNKETLDPRDRHALSMIRELQLIAQTKKIERELKEKHEKKKAGQVKVGRNEPCPCGSGKKYKRCCA